VIPGSLGLHRVGFGSLGATTAKADDAACDSGEHEDHQSHPESRAGGGMSTNVVHLSLDPNKESNIDSEYDERKESSEEGHKRCDQGYGEMSGEGEAQSDENDGRGDGVND